MLLHHLATQKTVVGGMVSSCHCLSFYSMELVWDVQGNLTGMLALKDRVS